MADQPVPSNPPEPKEPASSPKSDHQPLKVGHGRKILERIGETRRDVVTTVANTEAILTMLSPAPEGEEDPILVMLEQIILAQRHQQGTLEDILKRLSELSERLGRLERRSR